MTDLHAPETEAHARDPLEVVRRGSPVDGQPVRMLPAEAYTSPEVLAWEKRHLFAGSWTCLGRPEDLLPATGPKPVTQRAVMVGDIACLLVRSESAAPVPRAGSACTRTPAATAATSCSPTGSRRSGGASSARTTRGPTTSTAP